MAISKFGKELGHMLVGMICKSDPGADGFKNPHTKTNNVMEIVAMIPSKLNIDNIGNGMNVNGVNTKNDNILNRVAVHTSSSPSKAYNESLNSTISEIPEPTRSTQKINEINNLATDP